MQKEIGWLLNEKYGGRKAVAFKKDVARLQKGEPVDYVIGFTNFLGCKIDLSKKPLIPRPETEFWVQKAIDQIYSNFYTCENQSIKILDMFAGSGCIGVSIMAQLSGPTPPRGVPHIENVHVTFAEKERNALAQIKVNCKLNGIDKKRFHVIQSDIFSNVKGAYDYIFANPPYIPTTRKHKIQPSVLRFEPKTALFGGVDGLLYVRKFLAVAKNFLNPGSVIYMEFDYIQQRAIKALAKKYGYQHCSIHKDQYGKPRWVVLQ